MGPWWRPSLHFSCFKSPCLRRNGDQASGKTMPPFSHLPTTSCRSFKETKMVNYPQIHHRLSIYISHKPLISWRALPYTDKKCVVKDNHLGITRIFGGFPNLPPWPINSSMKILTKPTWTLKNAHEKSLQLICLENHSNKKHLFMSESPWVTVGSQVFMKSPVFPTWILSTTYQTLHPGNFTKKNMVASSCWLCGSVLGVVFALTILRYIYHNPNSEIWVGANLALHKFNHQSP